MERKPRPILKDIRIDDGNGIRNSTLAGYLLSQVRPSIEWSGLTARVQNVAVEERTFFDLESDPGFRKYICGEVWLLGDFDRARLINIDRASFNRESADYEAIARAMRAELQQFKSERIQGPQRAKVSIKQRLDRQIAIVNAASTFGAALGFASPLEASNSTKGVPSSNNGAIKLTRARGLLEDLQELGAVVAIDSEVTGGRPYRLKIAPDGRRVLAEVRNELVHPRVEMAGATYSLRLVEGRASDPPMIVKNRPREIVLNLAHSYLVEEFAKERLRR